MSGALTIFQFEQRNVRTVIQNGEPWFIAADVCEVLNIRNSRDALSRIPEDEKGVGLSDTLGGVQQMTIVNEPGLYRLIFRSDKPEAERFRKWVFSEVLPAIRKTGAYALPSRELSPLEILKQQVALMEAQQAQLAQHEARLAAIEARQSAVEEGAQYFTVIAYFRLRNLGPIDYVQAQRIGMRCANLSRQRGVAIGKASDPRFGSVNAYHESVLADVCGVTQ